MRRSRLVATAAASLLATGLVMAAGPAWATTAAAPLTPPTLAPCTPNTTAAPATSVAPSSTVEPAPGPRLYNGRCSLTPTVAAAGTGWTVTVTLPGVGTLTFNLTPAGTVDATTPPSVAPLAGSNFSAGTPHVSVKGNVVSVTFVNAADPHQTDSIKVVITPPTSVGGVPTVVATGGSAGRHKHHGDGSGRPDRDGHFPNAANTTPTSLGSGGGAAASLTGNPGSGWTGGSGGTGGPGAGFPGAGFAGGHGGGHR